MKSIESPKINEAETFPMKIKSAPRSHHPNLNKITELTDESQTMKQRSRIRQNIKTTEQSIPEPAVNVSLWKRCYQCLKYTFEKCLNSRKNKEIFVEESQMSYIIERLKRKKVNTETVLPPQEDQKKTLVLDLDETLIHTSFREGVYHDFQIEMESKGKAVRGYVSKRFGLDSFLFEMSQRYELILFSASRRKYMDAILPHIDPKKHISYSLSREHCICINKSHYLKPLKILGRPMNNIILVDNQKMAGILNPENFYRIQPFTGNMKDRRLLKLSSFLKQLSTKQEVIPVSFYRKKFQNVEIRITQPSLHQKNHERKSKRYAHLHSKPISEQTNTELVKKSSNELYFDIE